MPRKLRVQYPGAMYHVMSPAAPMDETIASDKNKTNQAEEMRKNEPCYGLTPLGDFVGASSYFPVASSDNYLHAFFAVGTANAASAINQIGTLTPVYIYDDRAEYYFTSTSIIAGQTIGFPVEFDKENGVWKIIEF